MNFSIWGSRSLSWGFAVALSVSGLTLACGGDDDSSDEPSGGAGGSAGQTSGSAGKANAGSGGVAKAGSSGSSSSGSAGKPSGTAGSAGTMGSGGSSWSGNFDDCDPPMEGVENCEADNSDHAGTSVCTEFYTAGQAKLICGELAKTGPCARGESLYGICVAGFSSYQYDSAGDGATFFSQSPRLCEAQGAKWCGPR